MNSSLHTLYGYHAWANSELLGKVELLDPTAQKAERDKLIRIINHYHVVTRIFAAHLSGTRHPYGSDNTAETPALRALQASVAEVDQWYLDYVRTVSPAQLSEFVPFTFTDGDKGCMTREEMLLHVALHSALHRGEVGRMLLQLSISPPWDTFAVYLHQAEPARRQQSGSAAA